VRDGRDVRCLRVTVPLRHGQSGGATIEVGVSVLAAERDTGRRPLVVLPGGPGEAIAGLAPLIASPKNRSVFTRLLRTRDLVLVDQRGAGLSRPALTCGPEQAELVPALASATDDATISRLTVAAYSGCGERLRRAVDLRAFTTEAVARDLQLVVGALRLSRADVFATSYGTKVALAAARQRGGWIGRLLLSSAVAPGSNFIADASRSFTRALRATFAACAEARRCAAANPDLDARLESAITGLETTPLPIPPSGRSPGGTLTAWTASSVLFSLYYVPGGFGAVPRVVDLLARRDPRLAAAGGGEGGALEGLARGQQYAILCQEELGRTDPEALLRAAAQLPAVARVQAQYDVTVGAPAPTVCAGYGVRPVTEPAARLGSIGAPALVVSGAFDQITPPAYGAAVARGLRDARHVVLASGHSPVATAGPCGAQVAESFLDGRRLPRCAR
jgi:pimeloyl-ACP methyl ester carboxylesterase